MTSPTALDLHQLLELAAQLQSRKKPVGEQSDFRRARIVLQAALEAVDDPASSALPDDLQREIVLAYSRAWFNDLDLHQFRATNEAWKILGARLSLDGGWDPEVLGLAGRINRRRWQLSGQSRDLRRATYLYHLGFEPGAVPPPEDRDYGRFAMRTALNGLTGAILLVELARLEERTLNDLEAKARHERRVPSIEELRSDPATREVIAGIEGLTAAELRTTAGSMLAEALRILIELSERSAGGWLMHIAIAALRFGQRDYDGAKAAAGRFRDFVASEDLDSDDKPSPHEKQRWIREFVAMARQRGIRPEVEVSLQAREGRKGESGIAAVDVRAVDALRLDTEGLEIGEIANRLGFPDVHAARHAIVRAEQNAVIAVVGALLPEDQEDLAFNFLRGKTGIALSGGGLRAALFHAGVLAALADLDLLRDIEVLSCVSGGSIAGIDYYLRIKQLHERHVDAAIDQSHYIEIVQELCRDLHRGAADDLRSRVFANLWHNLRMLRKYSPSMRLGHLLQDRVLPSVIDRPGGEPPAGREVKYLSQLRIRPLASNDQGESKYDENFSPRRHNWTRRHKVPVLVLNATSLNTGHNWQFTAAHMGEPPAVIHPEIDSNPRLRRVPIATEERPGIRRQAEQALRRFTELSRSLPRLKKGVAPESTHESIDEADRSVSPIGGPLSPFVRSVIDRLELDQIQPTEAAAIPVGHAVAASAAVPGLFAPLSLPGGYPPMMVKLADGGIVDNQGISGLFEQDCDTLYVSDASRQLAPAPDPSGGVLPVFRSSTISKQRIRAAQYDELRTRRRSQRIRDFLFIHLSAELDAEPIGWFGATEPSLVRGAKTVDDDGCTSYGVDRAIQSSLARMRTDIDVFSELESNALMASGYLMTMRARPEGIGPFRYDVGRALADARWEFLEVEPLIGRQVAAGQDPALAAQQERVRKRLAASARPVFRTLKSQNRFRPTPRVEAHTAGAGNMRSPGGPAWWAFAAVMAILAAAVAYGFWIGGEPYRLEVSVSKTSVSVVLVLAVLATVVPLSAKLPVSIRSVVWGIVLLFASFILFVVSRASLFVTWLSRAFKGNARRQTHASPSHSISS